MKVKCPRCGAVRELANPSEKLDCEVCGGSAQTLRQRPRVTEEQVLEWLTEPEDTGVRA